MIDQQLFNSLKIKERQNALCEILRSQYNGLTENLTDAQIMNDIVTILMARKIWKEQKSSPYKALYHALDNL